MSLTWRVAICLIAIPCGILCYLMGKQCLHQYNREPYNGYLYTAILEMFALAMMLGAIVSVVMV